jgi:2-polyprenyl-3-methyl-5-hydroxy-6-metoxy-1,4-benzoquinol methylase
MSALAQSRPWSHIECEPAENCALCGSKGDFLYRGIKDHLFGVEGRWNIRRCSDDGCGLIWIDPIPLKSELWKAYSNYYTHQDEAAEYPSGIGFKYWAYKFYESTIALTPIARHRRELQYMFLERAKPGRLLEVGCGDGSRLALFREAGWAVEGVEVDEEAARLASSKHRVTVRHGELSDLHYRGDSFDAVIMNHVLEHVHEPRSLVAECFRLLRPGGTFVAVTPNADSFGQSHFQQYWIGLDPPRHLHVFNPRNLLCLVQPIPAAHKDVWTSAANAELICGWSLRTLREQKKSFLPRVPRMFAIAALQYAAGCSRVFNRNSGEECVLRLVK